jgi:hypothetical protein
MGQSKGDVMERLSGDYIRGYTKAIQDITEVFTYIVPDLKHHHLSMNSKQSLKLLKAILENREQLRDDWRGFIRYNGVINDFEWFRSAR